MRNRDGKLTRFCTGRRFVYISVPDHPLEKTLKVGSFTAMVYHKEQPKVHPKEVTCGRCLKVGHQIRDCQETEFTCRACKRSGHRQGDSVCQMTDEEHTVTEQRQHETIDPPPASHTDSDAETDIVIEEEEEKDSSDDNRTDTEKPKQTKTKAVRGRRSTKAKGNTEQTKKTGQTKINFRSRSETPKPTQLSDNDPQARKTGKTPHVGHD